MIAEEAAEDVTRVPAWAAPVSSRMGRALVGLACRLGTSFFT